ncbi:hypothetical protein FRC07_009528 [Ceratobasidium sp. 392]|nr:hypothetical protein FRC07_009528 [Ceratobasidium sp. 392]
MISFGPVYTSRVLVSDYPSSCLLRLSELPTRSDYPPSHSLSIHANPAASTAKMCARFGIQLASEPSAVTPSLAHFRPEAEQPDDKSSCCKVADEEGTELKPSDMDVWRPSTADTTTGGPTADSSVIKTMSAINVTLLHLQLAANSLVMNANSTLGPMPNGPPTTTTAVTTATTPGPNLANTGPITALNHFVGANRPEIHLAYVPIKPPGTAGKAWKLNKVLKMTNNDFGLTGDVMKVALMQTHGINMNMAFSYQNKWDVQRVVEQAAKVLYEFDIYRGVDYWPLYSFAYLVLKVASDLGKGRGGRGGRGCGGGRGRAPAAATEQGGKPEGNEPTGGEPTGEEPMGSEPTGSEPTGDEPGGDELMGGVAGSTNTEGTVGPENTDGTRVTASANDIASNLADDIANMSMDPRGNDDDPGVAANSTMSILPPKLTGAPASSILPPELTGTPALSILPPEATGALASPGSTPSLAPVATPAPEPTPTAAPKPAPVSKPAPAPVPEPAPAPTSTPEPAPVFTSAPASKAAAYPPALAQYPADLLAQLALYATYSPAARTRLPPQFQLALDVLFRINAHLWSCLPAPEQPMDVDTPAKVADSKASGSSGKGGRGGRGKGKGRGGRGCGGGRGGANSVGKGKAKESEVLLDGEEDTDESPAPAKSGCTTRSSKKPVECIGL